MMQLYQFLDVAGTLVEIILYYTIVSCLLRKDDGYSKNRKYIQLLPYILLFVLTYLLTWYTDIGTFRMVIIIVTIALLIWPCYKTTALNALIASILGSMSVLLTESIYTMLGFLIYPAITIQVDGQVLMHWSFYVVAIIVRIFAIVVFRGLFKKFLYHFTWKDLVWIALDGAAVYVLYAFNNQAFFEGNSQYFNIVLETISIIVFTAMFIPILLLKNYYSLREQRKQDQFLIEKLQQQYLYYQDKQKEEERVRSLYHDMKNHLLVLQAQMKKSGDAQQSIQELQDKIEGYETFQHTGNELLDVIIQDKAKKAQERDIDFSAVLHFEDGGFIEPLDISTIFGNALDNALEASMKLPQEERVVTAKADRIRNMLSIVFENHTIGEIDKTNKSTKEDKFLHGFGIRNIKKAVGKYGGQCSIKVEKGMFSLKIIIPVIDK